jgi:RNase P subunit RPR2
MPKTQHQDPHCAACGSLMKPTAVEENTPSQDLGTFTCLQCKRVQRYLLESAVGETQSKPKPSVLTYVVRDGRLIPKSELKAT